MAKLDVVIKCNLDKTGLFSRGICDSSVRLHAGWDDQK